MRLDLFRKKLAYEVKEVERIIQHSKYHNQEVQVHIYCIAAFLRKITTRLTRFEGFQISVIGLKEKNISLKNLVNRILHYSYFIPGNMRNPRPSGPLKTIRILSDKDEVTSVREIGVMDFVEIAKQIAEEDDAILFDLLDDTKRNLKKVVHSSSANRFDEIETMESLMDFFELSRKTRKIDVPGGKIALFQEKHENTKNIIEVTGIKTYEINYEILFQKLFYEWEFIPFRQFRTHSGNFDELKSHKTIDLNNFSGEDSHLIFGKDKVSIFMIRAKDLLDFLCAIQQ